MQSAINRFAALVKCLQEESVDIMTMDHLVLCARDIQPGQSREYRLCWDITTEGVRLLGLKLAQHRSGGTYRVTKIGEHWIRVEATESPRGFTISGRPNADLSSDDDLLRRRRR